MKHETKETGSAVPRLPPNCSNDSARDGERATGGGAIWLSTIRLPIAAVVALDGMEDLPVPLGSFKFNAGSASTMSSSPVLLLSYWEH